MPLILINWTCLSCALTGQAIAESSAMIEHRVRLSHQAKQPFVKAARCPNPLFELRARYEPAAEEAREEAREGGRS